jgi:hypothetical protein
MDFSQFPDPHASVAGDRHTENRPGLMAKIARLWRPRGASEPELSTLARFAGRLIDRKTGRAYSADELGDFIKDYIETSVLGLRTTGEASYDPAFTVGTGEDTTAAITWSGNALFSDRLTIEATGGPSTILMRNHVGTLYELTIDESGELQIQESA